MRRLFCRGLRLELVAALGMALIVPALAAQSTQAAGLKSTATTLSAGSRVLGSHTQAALTVAVMGEDGLPATGSVVIEEDGRQLAGVSLSAEGRASLEVSLPAGEHNLTAVYGGDATHQASTSKIAGVRAQATPTTPDFSISVAPASISLTAGQSSTSIGVPLIVSITPINASALTAPMFVTLSCSGYPDQSTCTFTPENVEILPNQLSTNPTLSSMVIATQAKSLVGMTHPSDSNPVAWAVMLPGILGLGGLAFSVRRHRYLHCSKTLSYKCHIDVDAPRRLGSD